MATDAASQPLPAHNGAGDHESSQNPRDPVAQAWLNATRVVLQPIAAPSILGLFGFAIATFMVSTNIAGWYGSPTTSPLYLFPLAGVAGGVTQLIASVWAFRARDSVATVVHGIWGSFWLAYSILYLFVAVGVLHLPVGKFPALGFWFFPLAAVTASCAFASLRHSLGITVTLIGLAGGAALLGIGYLIGSHTWLHVGGWVLFADSVAAFYSASALMYADAFGRVVLPLMEPRANANLPGDVPAQILEYKRGEPGVRKGQ